jgi:hypothetical protein
MEKTGLFIESIYQEYHGRRGGQTPWGVRLPANRQNHLPRIHSIKARQMTPSCFGFAAPAEMGGERWL